MLYKNTILLNFLGSPSTGKTSLSAKVFARLKAQDIDCEYVSEYVKGWAWEGRTISPFDQFYIFGKECHNQSMLFNKVKVIISDSPVMLSTFYHLYYNGDNSLSEPCHYFYDRAIREFNIIPLNFYLPRKREYNPNGRFQTEQQADELALMLKDWLYKEGYNYEELTCDDEDRADLVLNRVLRLLDGEEIKCGTD